ncbi:hypothetical protein OG2516_14643 [Oceanicola granulosus HTCC2516]|uniref:Glycosyltransferase 2-like domain-containing protein n=1 Tax=Oceanicola granulosus (strain ATCC BAA-861 / DSM 15982 / KCTC 12143 / HTCC2516) TaxID=314256 RepID=Q2CC87_OCEGH|nr:glycosyltransferase family 2 protein [Oceanicola granulosus]EAR50273.1 hypothetical protein OG2516_14643 [Oceanicola granulosus HTCC2516]
MDPHVAIVIPTYNRAHLIGAAVDAALAQSHPRKTVVVVDDGSTDDTRAALARFAERPDFLYIRLARNVGTAQAKNVGLALTAPDAWTFHDSDDRPHPDKVLLQARTLAQPEIGAHPCLNWKMAGHEPNSTLQVGLVLTHHELVLPDGRRVEIRRDLSIVDDIFPNLQMGSRVPGEWTHINSGLFHVSLFQRLGGFSDCVEEDREIRNRILFGGEIVWVLPEILLTKIETADSLTQSTESDYDSERRKRDRAVVWAQAENWRAGGSVEPVPIELADLEVAEVWNPEHLAVSPALMSDATAARVAAIIAAQGDGGLGLAAQ